MSTQASNPPRNGAPPGEPAVSIRGLNYRFGQGDLAQQVLFDIDLDIYPGELVILTGPSGCGKTTLLTLIGALRSVQEGSLQVLGRQMRGLNKSGLIEARRRIGFIFQAHNLLDALTAAGNVSLSLDLQKHTPASLRAHAARVLGVLRGDSGDLDGVPRGREAVARFLATRLLAHLDLHQREDHKPNQLSGGQKQRVAIARAVCNLPGLILADEPTAALDKGSSAIVIDLLKKLTHHGATILVVTHDNRIMDRGDRVVTMKDGRVQSNVLVDETVRVCVFLQKVPLFAGLTPSQLVEVAEKMHREVYPPDATIVRQGEAGERWYLIKEGKVEVRVDDPTGSRVVATLDGGQFFGETAILEDKARNASVITRERVEVYSLQKEDFLEARRAFEPMREELMKVFAQRYRYE
ncbi:MAG TPA: ATP-binding cassette domain-containing protein [Gemmataceae bacterium]|jgi:putative ABC transport system ATP-binding protein